MGERATEEKPPPNIEIDNLRIGSQNLSQWLQLPGGRSPVQKIAPILLPTQEMRPFQREVRASRQDQAVGIGQQAAFSITVPNDENWKLLLMWIEHVDMGFGGGVFEFKRTMQHLLPGLFFSLWEGELEDGGGGQVIYPTAVQRARIAVDNFVDIRGNALVEFYRGDVIAVTQNKAAVTAGVARVAIVYELIPALSSVEDGPDWFSTAA